MTRPWLMVLVTSICASGTACSSSGMTSARDRILADTAADGSALDFDVTATHASSAVLPRYDPTATLSGTMISIGSSTTTNLVARVAAEFKQMYPDVQMQISASLTAAGLTALMDGGADIVPMSRSLAPEEISMFAASRGYPPTEIKVAADALAIFVHKSSPLQGLTLEQLHDIFSHAQHPGRNWIETWGQLGLEGEWKDRPIALYGYSADDGAYDTFQRKVLDGGSFRLTVKAERGGSSIVQDIAAEPGGIGYASIFFACNRIRAVPLMGIDGNLHHPTEEGVGEREYPLRRFLYICVDKPPHQALTGPAREFLRFLLSREGQQVVADGGNYSLDAATVEEGRRALGE